MSKRPGETLFIAAVLAAVAGILFVLAPSGLYSNEDGVSYVQMKNFVLNGSLEITWPGIGLGFDAKDIAARNGFFESRSGRLYAITPPLFPWLVSLFHPFFGERAIDFAPLLFVFLSALVLGATLDREMHRGVLYYLLLAAFLAGSPVLLLAYTHSGQSLALFLIVSGLSLLVRHFKAANRNFGSLAGSSFLVGSAVLVSLEFLFIAVSFLLSAGAVFSIQKRWKDLAAVVAGAAAVLVAFVLQEALLHGGFPGPYLKMMLPFYGLSGIRSALFAGCLIVSCALFAASRSKGAGPVLRSFLTVLPVILLSAVVLLSAARITVFHLMAVFPAVLFAFYGLSYRTDRLLRGEGSLESILSWTVILCLILGAVIHRPDLKRVLAVWFPLVPFVILLLGAEHRRIFDDSKGMYVVLLFFCGVALMNSFQEARSDLWLYRDFNARRIEFLRQHTAAGDAVIFYDAASLEHACPLFFDRVFLMSNSPGDQERFARRLAERGIDRAYAWTLTPLSIKGFNPYREKSLSAFTLSPGAESCSGGSCKERNVYLVRLDTRAVFSTGVGRGGS